MIRTAALLLTAFWAFAPIEHVLVITTKAPLQELSHGYLQWQHTHPEAKVPGQMYKLEMPAIDVYGPDGKDVYYSAGDDGENAAYVETLIHRQSPRRQEKLSKPRPNLDEAIDMFPELKDHKDAILAGHRYTLFAVTYPGWSEAKKQNDAVSKLKSQAEKAGIQVVEVNVQQ